MAGRHTYGTGSGRAHQGGICHRPSIMRHFIAVLLFLIQESPSATYYSDPAAGTAAGDGSAEAPWPKLQEVPHVAH